MKLYAHIVAVSLQVAGWSAAAVSGYLAWRQFHATPGWIASYSGLDAYKLYLPAVIAVMGLLLAGIGVMIQLLARKD